MQCDAATAWELGQNSRDGVRALYQVGHRASTLWHVLRAHRAHSGYRALPEEKDQGHHGECHTCQEGVSKLLICYPL